MVFRMPRTRRSAYRYICAYIRACCAASAAWRRAPLSFFFCCPLWAWTRVLCVATPRASYLAPYWRIANARTPYGALCHILHMPSLALAHACRLAHNRTDDICYRRWTDIGAASSFIMAALLHWHARSAYCGRQRHLLYAYLRFVYRT